MNEKILKKAGIEDSPGEFRKKALLKALLLSLGLSLPFGLVFLKEKIPFYYFGLLFLLAFLLMFLLMLSLPQMRLKSKKASLESDLLYSARFLLLKLESGSSLLNALEEVAILHTRSAKYFQELVADVHLGTPIEEAIKTAMVFSPSRAFNKIMEEILDSLKTGADIEKSLKNTLDDLTKQHVINIKSYGKKLGPASMFYMIIGTIIPSLGTALFVVASGFIDLKIGFNILLIFAFGLLMLQAIFILIFKLIKPPVMT